MQLADWRELNDSLIANRIPFTVEKTTFTIKFNVPSLGINDEFILRDSNSLPQSELWFIRRVKEHAATLKKRFDVDKETIRYISTNPFFRNEFIAKDIIEIDLKSAYWNIAYREGIINEALFNMPDEKNISKGARLMALGALAKQTYCWTFDGKHWHTPPPIKSKTENYFFHCCAIAGEIMNELKYLCLEGFIFFWVDAIFIFKPSQKIAINYLKQINMPYKKYKIDYVKFKNDCLIVKSKERELAGKETEPRIFQLKKNEFDLLDK